MSPRRLKISVLSIPALALSAGLSIAIADEKEPEIDATVAAILEIDGDPAYGEFLGGECATCHRRSAPAEGIPQISGIDEHHFVRAMVEYREGVRANEVMRTTAARLSDEEIAALAAHFTEREPR
ncbi:MAG: c-type cytochrome [Rhizobiaceae bacterium]